ncbi:glycosyltransferase [Mucilaginibacter celer]|uniref:Glycosyltransferase family 1 protein n=1 Tax=Mucilaginibacter celer TaxID=2305508 RepID=A0A494W0U7_9SPHI|nr:glycosyltransferase [Mucilaginibacter celer]AYL97125.1 glycosyltransferase family 1 protein [Mucilaginibacter celer]
MEKILFYQLDSKLGPYESWKAGKYFGHTLFGATHFPNYGIDVEFSTDNFVAKAKKFKKNFRLDLRFWYHPIKLFFNSRKYDAIYAPYPRGLELLILLRRLRLYRKPIIVFVGYRVLNESDSWLKKFLIRQYYAGIDKILFFTQADFDEATDIKLAKPSAMHKVNWGPDLDFYDRKIKEDGAPAQNYFISVGKANRDHVTLVKSFEGAQRPLHLYLDNEAQGAPLAGIPSNTEICYMKVSESSPGQLVEKLNKAIGVTICLKKTEGQQGISNLYEAMAMSKPVIMTKNRFIDVKVEQEGIGIEVDVDDVDGWKNAVKYLNENPDKAIEMGKKGRAIAEKDYNLNTFTAEVAEILKSLKK